MMRCTMPINERQRREPVVVGVLLRVGGVDDQLDHGNTSAVRADPMIQRPVTPNDIVMQRLHRDEGGLEMVGTVQRHERLARLLCVRVQWRKPMHYLTQWDTDTPFAVPPCGAKSHTKRDAVGNGGRAASGKLISRDTRLRSHEACCNAVALYSWKERFDCLREIP